ncbi:MAG: hypothetical protein NUV35_06765, partial [Syntrophomonadaceae bacterium]|nr:hypothetical protein [Syntrophomonadaceae bacterium]
TLPPGEEVSERFRQPLISLQGGTCLTVHDGGACPGCRGYLHFALSKLRRPDPDNPGQNLVDRRLPRHAHIHLGPHADGEPDPKGTHLFMGICRQHQAHLGTHLPGCPPHAEVILNGVFGLFPGVERPSYADKSEEATLGEMLEAILARERVQE